MVSYGGFSSAPPPGQVSDSLACCADITPGGHLDILPFGYQLIACGVRPGRNPISRLHIIGLSCAMVHNLCLRRCHLSLSSVPS
jgi:hypothetical protein